MPYYYQLDFRISNFAQAEETYKEVKPIRGKDGDIRPLGDRRKQHYRIVKIDDDTYACRLYNTDVATYYRDGKVKIDLGGWDTPTTRGFLQRVLPFGWDMLRYNTATHITKLYPRPINEVHENYYYILGDTPVYINNNNDEVTGYKKPTKTLVNREDSKARRERYTPFLQFAKTMLEVLQFDVPKPENHNSYALMQEFMTLPEKFTEDRYIEVLSAFVHHGWYPRKYHQIKNSIYKEATVYDTIDLPLGSLQGVNKRV